MKYNFYAGPAILPQEVMKAAAAAIVDFNEMGLSLLEISHRSKPFVAVMDEARSLVKELLDIGNDHEVLFLGGGASTQFSMLPMNLLDENGHAAYIDTGRWASNTIRTLNFWTC
ncbi:MAG: aminotransferase class V-fold PLP-dependent enzyme [Chitinophagales bacterium]|nr:aminotransferase class V-fold PLP-dependent enzyme [Chitinophagales bacterium]